MSVPTTRFSTCRKYRYTLWREWAGAYSDLPTIPARRDGFVQFVCLNPSTADEVKDDPTVSKCILLAQKWGFAGMVMTNVFAFRATDPREMVKQEDPIGPDNLFWIEQTARHAAVVVCAWGNDGAHLGRGTHISDVLRQLCPRKLSTLATAGGQALVNKTGHPAHPLYQRNDSNFAHWKGIPYHE